jgi:hypothetical protein
VWSWHLQHAPALTLVALLLQDFQRIPSNVVHLPCMCLAAVIKPGAYRAHVVHLPCSCYQARCLPSTCCAPPMHLPCCRQVPTKQMPCTSHASALQLLSSQVCVMFQEEQKRRQQAERDFCSLMQSMETEAPEQLEISRLQVMAPS